MLALSTGARAAELHNLRWSEVTLTETTLLKTKNKSVRTVPLNSDALDALAVLKAFDEKTGYVCPRQHYRVWFEIALKAAKIDNFRFHDLRHTFASRATMAGVDIKTLAELMGHRTLQMTARYSHLSKPHLADAVSKIANFSESIPQSIHSTVASS